MIKTIHGMVHLQNDQAIETVKLKGTELSLIISGDGTEVIRHRLNSGYRWAMGPEDGWDALESIIIVNGSLTWHLPEGKVTVKTGDTLFAAPVKEDLFFTADEDCEFLYICSRPVFHNYSNVLQEMKELTISVEQKDGYTADHCQRIMELSMMVGHELRLSPSQLYHLNLGSFLHDIGKVKVPEEILNKPSKLTADEWEIMKQHTTFGREIIEETQLSNLTNSALIVEQHHERYDGTGYPHQLKGDQILIESAIVSVVDSYDAMTTDRVYSKGRPKEVALAEIMKGRETLYHPQVVDAFISISDKI